MTTRNPSRRFSPSLPSGKHIGIALASAAVGIVIGAAVVSPPFQSWFESEDGATVASVPQATTNIAPASGVTNDSVQPSAQERRLSPTGVTGFRDFDPDVVVPNFSSAAASPDPTSVYEALGDLTGAGVSSNEVRKLSPNGTNGFRDFDPAVVTPNLVSPDEVRKLSPNGTNGFRDFDPSVTFASGR